MPTVTSDIVFECPRCHGSIMVEDCHVGSSSDCPHCFEPIEIPDGSVVNKEIFMEPPGLRRMLREVHDREWEHMRRKLRVAKAHILRLEKHSEEVRNGAAAQLATETEALRKQLAELGDKFVLANQAFTAGRKQHDLALENLRRDLEAAHEEAQSAQKKEKAAAAAVRAAAAEAEMARQEAISATDEVVGLKAALEWSRCETAEAEQKRSEAETELQALREESARSLAHLEQELKTKSEAASSEELAALTAELEKSKKSRAAASAAKDRLRAEVEELRLKLAERDMEDGMLEGALKELKAGARDVMEALEARRERSEPH